LVTMQTTTVSTTSRQMGNQILMLNSFKAPNIKNINTKIQLTESYPNGSGATQPPIQWVQGALPPGGKAAGA
jgi:hypothetical protein